MWSQYLNAWGVPSALPTKIIEGTLKENSGVPSVQPTMYRIVKNVIFDVIFGRKM